MPIVVFITTLKPVTSVTRLLGVIYTTISVTTVKILKKNADRGIIYTEIVL